MVERIPLSPSTPLASGSAVAALAAEVRALAAERGITPMPQPPEVRPGLSSLGQALVFDKILSGNRNIACMTCHLPRFALGDERSLAIGEGATGLGPDRVHPGQVFEERNALLLFNTWLLDNLFWDGACLGGRERRRPFAGRRPDHSGDGRRLRVRRHFRERLGASPQYRKMFQEAYPGQDFDDMTFAHASNAMAAFIIERMTFANAPWDRFLAGNDRALTLEQLNGARKFMDAPCSRCHNGPTFSDDGFHNVALAQLGPGKGNGPSGRDDFGRRNVTGDPGDIYRFRTTMLRNVELTGPYGHAGQFAPLSGFIDHYSRSDEKLRAFINADIPEPLLVGALLEANKEAIIDTRSPIILGVAFDSVFVREVAAFMRALTDHRARDLDNVVPRKVPSRLPIDR